MPRIPLIFIGSLYRERANLFFRTKVLTLAHVTFRCGIRHPHCIDQCLHGSRHTLLCGPQDEEFAQDDSKERFMAAKDGLLTQLNHAEEELKVAINLIEKQTEQDIRPYPSYFIFLTLDPHCNPTFGIVNLIQRSDHETGELLLGITRARTTSYANPCSTLTIMPNPNPITGNHG